MKVRIMIEEPQAVEATMKITQSIKEWENLRDQLAEKWPASRLSMAITDLLSQVRKVFYHEKDVF